MEFDKSVVEEQFFGTSTVGERGQVVIPAEARKKMGIHQGDKMLVLGHPGGGGVMFFRIDSVREALSYFLSSLDAVQAKDSEHEQGSEAD